VNENLFAYDMTMH